MHKTYILHAKIKKKHITKYWENLFNTKWWYTIYICRKRKWNYMTCYTLSELRVKIKAEVKQEGESQEVDALKWDHVSREVFSVLNFPEHIIT